MSADRLALDLDYLSPDDVLNVTLTAVESYVSVAEQLAALLTGDAGRTMFDLSVMLDVPVLVVAHAFAYLVQAGALFFSFPVAGGERGYRLTGWA